MNNPKNKLPATKTQATARLQSVCPQQPYKITRNQIQYTLAAWLDLRSLSRDQNKVTYSETD